MSNPWWPVAEPDSLGELIGADDVRDQVKATIDLWSTYYLAVLSTRLGNAGRIGGTVGGVKQPPNPLPNFGKWVNEPSHRSWGTGQPASFLVTVPATVGTPAMHGDGYLTCTWRAQVSIQVFGTDWQEAADLTNWYEKVVRWSVLQHRSLGGFAQDTRWAGASYNGKEHTSTRTEGVVSTGFDVVVFNTINARMGPLTVPGTGVPPGQDPTVDDVILELTKTPVNKELP